MKYPALSKPAPGRPGRPEPKTGQFLIFGAHEGSPGPAGTPKTKNSSVLNTRRLRPITLGLWKYFDGRRPERVGLKRVGRKTDTRKSQKAPRCQKLVSFQYAALSKLAPGWQGREGTQSWAENKVMTTCRMPARAPRGRRVRALDIFERATTSQGRTERVGRMTDPLGASGPAKVPRLRS